MERKNHRRQIRNITLVALGPLSSLSLSQTSFRPVFASPVIFAATVNVRACMRDRPMRNGLDPLGGGRGTRWKNNKPRDTRRRGRRLRTTTYMDGWVYITSIRLRSHACRRSLAPYTPQTHTTTLHEPQRAVIIEYQTIIQSRFTLILLNKYDKKNNAFLFGRGRRLSPTNFILTHPPPLIFKIYYFILLSNHNDKKKITIHYCIVIMNNKIMNTLKIRAYLNSSQKISDIKIKIIIQYLVSTIFIFIIFNLHIVFESVLRKGRERRTN